MTAVTAGTPEPAMQRSPPRPAASTDILPTAARTKLITLAGLATDARGLAQSAHSRFADLRQLDYATMQPEKAASIETEMNRLLQVRRAQNERHSQLAALVAGIDHWVKTLPLNVHLEPAKPVAAKLLKAETVTEAIARVRDEITAMRQHLRTIQQAPLPKADLKKEAATFVQGLAAAGRPKISGNGSTFSVVFPDANSYAPMGVKTVAQMFAWLHSKEMIEALYAEIDALPEPPLSLSAKEKTKRLSELRTNLDGIERAEEALIEQAINAGQDVLRRVDASPLAVLGLRYRNKAERVRLA